MRDDVKTKVLRFQKNEITEHKIYNALAERVKGKNGEILKRIAADEKKHYLKWKKYTGKEVKPSKFTIFFISSSLQNLRYNLCCKTNGKRRRKCRGVIQRNDRGDPGGGIHPER